MYPMKDSCFYLAEDTDEGPKRTKLCNFRARITMETMIRALDGSIRRILTLEGQLEGGQKLPVITLPWKDFKQMDWPQDHWGLDVRFENVYRVKHHITQAILSKSKKRARLVEYAQVGFTDHNGELVYLSTSGAMTANGFDPEIRCTSNERHPLPHYIHKFQLVDPEDIDLDDALDAVAELKNISEAKPYIGTMLLAMPVAGVISYFAPLEFTAYFVGDSQHFKSSSAALVQSFFGAAFADRVFPAKWSDSETKIRTAISQLLHSCVVVDDLVQEGKINNGGAFADKVDNIIRDIGNKQPVGRTSKQHPLVTASTVLITTGQYVPKNVPDSIHPRILFVPFEEGDIDFDTIIRLHELAAEGYFVAVISAFIQYLLSQPVNRLRRRLEIDKEDWVDQAKEELGDGFKEREYQKIASLMAALYEFSRFIRQSDLNRRSQAVDISVSCWEDLLNLARLQSEILGQETFKHTFERIFCESLRTGQFHLRDYKTGGMPDVDDPEAFGWIDGDPQGVSVGWYDVRNDNTYLRSDVDTRSLVRSLSDQIANVLPEQEKRFSRRLNEEGLLRSRDEKLGTNTIRRQPEGRGVTEMVFHLDIAV